MIIAEADRLERETGSKYSLVILSAKRARHLKEGMTPLVVSTSANPLTVAFEEIAQGKVRPAGPEEETAVVGMRKADEPKAERVSDSE